MDPDSREIPNRQLQAGNLPQQNPPAEIEPVDFYHKRHLFYTSLLVFMILAGVPMIAVPPLRQRLMVRIQVLREAANSSGRLALQAKVGENPAPLPAEFVRQIQPVLPMPQIPNQIYPANRTYRPLPPPPEPPKRRAGLTLHRDSEESEPARAQAQTPVPAPEASGTEGSEPEFRQGKIEQEAYDLLLNSNTTVAGLVGGVNPALKFKTWAAAKMDEDIYYVRLTFIRNDGEAPYIWQIKLLSKQVTPLNFNARSLPSK